MSSPPVPPPPSKPPPRERFIRLGLVLLVVAIYGQTLGAGFIAFDDPGYVYDNAHVRAGLSLAGVRWAFSTFQQSNWHPLTWLSLQLDAQLYGLNAGGFHLTNLLLHAANTLLLFGWLRRTTRALWPAALVAFFFAAHPLHVESVAWVTERKDVLSTFFFCLTLLAYGRFVEGGPRRTRFYWLAAGLYGLSLLAKPMLVTLPLLLLLLDGWPLERFTLATLRGRGRALLVEKWPFGVLAAASCVVTCLAQRTQAMVSLETLPLGFRLASAALGVGTYLQKIFWPQGLGVFYPYWHQVAWWQPLCWGIMLAGLTALALWGGRAQPALAVGWLWFVGTLVPVIGLVQVGSQAVADRYTYVPHIGLRGRAGAARGTAVRADVPGLDLRAPGRPRRARACAGPGAVGRGDQPRPGHRFVQRAGGGGSVHQPLAAGGGSRAGFARAGGPARHAARNRRGQPCPAGCVPAAGAAALMSPACAPRGAGGTTDIRQQCRSSEMVRRFPQIGKEGSSHLLPLGICGNL